jgi:hypothetical protein
MSFIQAKKVAVTNAVTQLTDTVLSRESLLIENNGSVTVYVGNSDVTAATGFPIAANASLNDFPAPFTGMWFGIVSSGSSDVRVLEKYSGKQAGQTL